MSASLEVKCLMEIQPLWCIYGVMPKGKKFELKQKDFVIVGLLLFCFLSFGQKLFEANLWNSFTQESWSELGRENKVFKSFYFQSKTPHFFNCVHDIYFFSRASKNQKCFSLGLNKECLISPKWCVVLLRISFSWGQQHNHLASIKKKRKKFLILCSFVVW